MTSHFHSRSAIRRSERGYILIMLMLVVALLAIVATAVAPSVAFRVRRDREEEMIHRGVQYSRAIRRYVKKTGRYPSRLEDLENSNNIRFLRRRYKDPITNKDFKLLHVGEVQLTSAPVIAGATPIANAAAPAGGAALLGAATAMMAGAGAQTGPGSPLNPPKDSTESNDKDATGNPSASDAPKSGSDQTGSAGSEQLTSTVFGGGPMVGVASTSKVQSIREFNHKNHYNQWQFIYDPSMDRGGLIRTPAQPPLQNAAQLQQQNSSNSNPSSPNSSGPGSFGNQGTFGNAPGGGMQSAPPAQPTQQQ